MPHGGSSGHARGGDGAAGNAPSSTQHHHHHRHHHHGRHAATSTTDSVARVTRKVDAVATASDDRDAVDAAASVQHGNNSNGSNSHGSDSHRVTTTPAATTTATLPVTSSLTAQHRSSGSAHATSGGGGGGAATGCVHWCVNVALQTFEGEPWAVALQPVDRHHHHHHHHQRSPCRSCHHDEPHAYSRRCHRRGGRAVAQHRPHGHRHTAAHGAANHTRDKDDDKSSSSSDHSSSSSSSDDDTDEADDDNVDNNNDDDEAAAALFSLWPQTITSTARAANASQSASSNAAAAAAAAATTAASNSNIATASTASSSSSAAVYGGSYGNGVTAATRCGVQLVQLSRYARRDGAHDAQADDAHARGAGSGRSRRHSKQRRRRQTHDAGTATTSRDDHRAHEDVELDSSSSSSSSDGGSRSSSSSSGSSDSGGDSSDDRRRQRHARRRRAARACPPARGLAHDKKWQALRRCVEVVNDPPVTYHGDELLTHFVDVMFERAHNDHDHDECDAANGGRGDSGDTGAADASALTTVTYRLRTPIDALLRATVQPALTAVIDHCVSAMVLVYGATQEMKQMGLIGTPDECGLLPYAIRAFLERYLERKAAQQQQQQQQHDDDNAASQAHDDGHAADVDTSATQSKTAGSASQPQNNNNNSSSFVFPNIGSTSHRFTRVEVTFIAFDSTNIVDLLDLHNRHVELVLKLAPPPTPTAFDESTAGMGDSMRVDSSTGGGGGGDRSSSSNNNSSGSSTSTTDAFVLHACTRLADSVNDALLALDCGLESLTHALEWGLLQSEAGSSLLFSLTAFTETGRCAVLHVFCLAEDPAVQAWLSSTVLARSQATPLHEERSWASIQNTPMPPPLHHHAATLLVPSLCYGNLFTSVLICVYNSTAALTRLSRDLVFAVTGYRMSTMPRLTLASSRRSPRKLPSGWQELFTRDGQRYFMDTSTQTITSHDPRITPPPPPSPPPHSKRASLSSTSAATAATTAAAAATTTRAAATGVVAATPTTPHSGVTGDNDDDSGSDDDGRRDHGSRRSSAADARRSDNDGSSSRSSAAASASGAAASLCAPHRPTRIALAADDTDYLASMLQDRTPTTTTAAAATVATTAATDGHGVHCNGVGHADAHAATTSTTNIAAAAHSAATPSARVGLGIVVIDTHGHTRILLDAATPAFTAQCRAHEAAVQAERKQHSNNNKRRNDDDDNDKKDAQTCDDAVATVVQTQQEQPQQQQQAQQDAADDDDDDALPLCRSESCMWLDDDDDDDSSDKHDVVGDDDDDAAAAAVQMVVNTSRFYANAMQEQVAMRSTSDAHAAATATVAVATPRSPDNDADDDTNVTSDADDADGDNDNDNNDEAIDDGDDAASCDLRDAEVLVDQFAAFYADAYATRQRLAAAEAEVATLRARLAQLSPLSTSSRDDAVDTTATTTAAATSDVAVAAHSSAGTDEAQLLSCMQRELRHCAPDYLRDALDDDDAGRARDGALPDASAAARRMLLCDACNMPRVLRQWQLTLRLVRRHEAVTTAAAALHDDKQRAWLAAIAATLQRQQRVA